MRRTSITASVLLAGALVLAGCSSSGGSDATEGESQTPQPSAETTEPGEPGEPGDGAEAPLPEIAGANAGFTASGGYGDKPELTFEAEPPAGLQVETVSEGDGATVAAGDFVVANYLGQVWDTDNVFDNSYDRGAPTGFSLNSVIPGWSVGLVGQHVGSRLLLTVPTELGYAEGNPNAGIEPGDTIVFVVDVVDVFSNTSTGQADAEPTDEDVPVTYTGDLGAPVTEVTVDADAPEPTELVATPIALGTGAAVAAGDQVAVNYSLAPWDSSEFASTWAPDGTGPEQLFRIGGGSVFDALEGLPVGSRVFLATPAVEASGAPALAVVLDILASIPSQG